MNLYRSFLVRCWQEGDDRAKEWRFALLEIGPPTEPRGFADFEQLVRYLSADFVVTPISPRAGTAGNDPVSRHDASDDKGDGTCLRQ